MKYELAVDLGDRLRRACPVDTGALRMSISRVQGNEAEYIITIGNEQGKEINGKCATVEYAAVTNFARELNIHGKRYPNPNYHWVNDAVEKWKQANQFNFGTESEDDEDVDIY